MKVVVAGGSGFIGSALVDRLRQENHQVLIVSRHRERGQLTWKQLQTEGLPPCDAVINLAGASVAAKRWTPAYKRKLFASRIDTTRALVRAIAEAKSAPEVFINASGIGIYPPDPKQVYTEESPPLRTARRDLLGTLASQWEAVAQLPDGCSTRLVIIRIATVLGREGGALKAMLPIFRKGLGGPVGQGTQPFPWIHIDDLVSLFLFALKEHRVTGVLNGVSPESATNAEFTNALADALKRKAIFRVPASVLKLFLGERALLLLEGQEVRPKRTEELGFTFKYPGLRLALANIVKTRK